MSNLELKVPPVVLVFIAGALMWTLALAFPGASFLFPAAKVAGIAFGGLGVAVALLGVWAFRSAGTTVDPRVPDQSATLVVRGVYRISRNPMYLGFLLVLMGWGVILGNVPAFALLPAFVFYMNRFQIIPEERYMNAKFGEAFRQYTRKVRRWV